MLSFVITRRTQAPPTLATNPGIAPDRGPVDAILPRVSANASRANKALTPSRHAGMGANLYADNPRPDRGVSFRVWAPYAERVFVTGEFNGEG